MSETEKNGVVDPHWRVLQANCLAEMIEKKRSLAWPKLRPKTRGQALYMESINRNTVTICCGPAGTGKTYIPTGLGAESLRAGKIKRLILTRPLVTCSGKKGQGVGFLPGDLMAKISPHMRPMLDVLEKFMSPVELLKYIEEEIIELIPLDYMRGLSIDDAVIVADEMQNSDKDQMLMLLTRIGDNCKLIISGDETQVDLPYGSENTMLHAVDSLWDVEGIGTVTLTEEDIVRNKLIREIIRAWNT